MPRLTLNRVFTASLIGLVAGLALLFWLVFEGLQAALLRSADQARDRNSAVIAQSVSDYLAQAPAAAQSFESLLWVGFARPTDPVSLRNSLLAVLLHDADISEATFTYARRSGYDPAGRAIIDPASVGQLALFRARKRAGFVHRTTWYSAGRFIATQAHVDPNGAEPAAGAPSPAPNPADNLTFTTPVRKPFYGQLLWTDIHWSSLDQALPEQQRRVEVSVQKAVDYPAGTFVGVLRIGLFKDALDRALARPASIDAATHSIFLCDNQGRLIALPSSTAQYANSGDDVRLIDSAAPPQVLDALKRPSLATVSGTNPVVSDSFVTSGTTFLCTFRSLPDTRDWIVGMAVPRHAYLDALTAIGRNLMRWLLALLIVLTLCGAIALRAVSVAHGVILREAARMNNFELEPSRNSCNFSDIDEVLNSLERAKTAMRSMGKYVPLDLVRRLYHQGEEPHLGGDATELSVLFTDIQGFTEFAEKMDPDLVAARLGAYLEAMVSVIQRHKGTIDKFIGDSVMAFWNAPEPVPGHPAVACRAALGCREALRLLYASPAWDRTPRFETRFGLHLCVASVGHFGAPARFNYTAIGDGVNLASRLEGLNKHYGTSIIVTGALRMAAGPGFLFRHLDCVAVKGKSQCIHIYELIGAGSQPLPEPAAAYERALESWFRGDFSTALALAEALAQAGDPPALFLAERCRRFLDDPPAGWAGIYFFDSK